MLPPLADKIVLGTAQFGMHYGISNTRGQVPLEEVCRILADAHKNGITALDTAAAYGESESVLGQALEQTKLRFDVVSKLPPIGAASDVRREVEASLEKLRVEKLYGYMLHSFSTYQEMPEVMEALSLLQEEGLVGKVGISLYHPTEAETLLSRGVAFNLTQFPFNVFDQRFESVLDQLQANQVEVHARSAFLQGLFFMEPQTLPPHLAGAGTKINELQQLARSAGIPLEAMLLLFVLLQPAINRVTLGVNSLKDLQQNLAVGVYLQRIQEMLPELRGFRQNDENILLPYKWKTT